jgi:hypothetical protein
MTSAFSPAARGSLLANNCCCHGTPLLESRAMKILLAGSELTPLARTGGLGDVLEALPGALVAQATR